jgi:hypothetical protein
MYISFVDLFLLWAGSLPVKTQIEELKSILLIPSSALFNH